MNTNLQDSPKKFSPRIFDNLSEYYFIIVTFILSAGIFYGARYLESQLYQIIITEYYLAIHTVLEFASIIMYIASFLIVYYVGERDNRIRLKILAGAMLFVGCIDFWHTFYYNGMPGLIASSSVQSATSYWIIGRIGYAGGLMVSSFISLKVRTKSVKNWMLAGSPLLLAMFFLFLISYFPNALPTLVVEGQGVTAVKQTLEYIIVVMLIIAFVNFSREYNRTKSSVLPLFLSVLIISVFSELAFVSYFSVYDTYNLLGHIYKLIASYMIFKVLFIYNITSPYNKLDKAEKEISKYANNLEQLVDSRTQEINQANQGMLRDLEYAKTIQKAVMSVKHERYGDLEVYNEYIPYEKVGGDYYGFEDLDEEHLVFYIGDVAGHGIPAAMMTIFMKQTIITQKLYQSGKKDIYTPKEVLLNLYKEYNAADFPLEMYAVMIYGIYNKKTNNLIFSSAGLNTYPLIYKEDGVVEPLEHTGFPICKFDKNYEPEFKDYIVPLKKGEKVLFYTDGLIDISNRRGEYFGEDKLIRILQEKGHLSPEECSQEILKEVKGFTKGVKINDDVHYFIMEVK